MSENAPDSPRAEGEAPKPRFVSRRERGIQKFYVIDPDADPEHSIVEPGTGERMRLASDDEQEVAVRQLAARDPEGPRSFQDAPDGPRMRETVEDSRAAAELLVNNLVELNDEQRAALLQRIADAKNGREITRIRKDAERIAAVAPSGEAGADAAATDAASVSDAETAASPEAAAGGDAAEEPSLAERIGVAHDRRNKTYNQRAANRMRRILRQELARREMSDDEEEAFSRDIENITDTNSVRRLVERLDDKPIPSDTIQNENHARRTRAEAAPTASEPAAEQEGAEPDDRTDADPVEDALRDLASRTPEERERIRNQQQSGQSPLDAHRARRDNLSDAINQHRNDYAEDHRGGHRGDHGGGEPPRRGATDALRNGGHSGHGHDAPDKYAIDRRNYIGLTPRSLQKLLADKEHQIFFGELLANIAPDLSEEDREQDPGALSGSEVLRKYKNGEKVSTKEMSLLTFATYEYAKWDREYTELAEHLTDEDIEMFQRRNANMENVIAHVGIGRTDTVFKNALRHAAFRDQETFEHMKHAIHEAHAARHSYLGRRAEKKIGKLSEELGIDRKHFEDVVDLSTPEAKQRSREHIEELMRAQAGTGRKFADWIAGVTRLPVIGSSKSAANNILRDADIATNGYFGMTGRRMRNLEGHLQHANESLDAIIGDDDTRDQIVREAMENRAFRPGSEAGPETFADMRTQVDAIREDDIEQTVRTHIAADPGWAGGDTQYRRQSLDRLKKKEEKKLKTGGGFWAWVKRIAYGDKFDKAARRVSAGGAGAAPAAAVH